MVTSALKRFFKKSSNPYRKASKIKRKINQGQAMAPKGYKNITIPEKLFNRIAQVDLNISVPLCVEKVVNFWENRRNNEIIALERAIARVNSFVKSGGEDEVWQLIEGILKRYRSRP